MKFKLLYTLFALAGGAFLFLGNSSGAGVVQGQDRTGSPLSGAACTACHGSTTFGPSVAVELLKDGQAVAAYTPGEVYTMRVTAGATGNPAVYGFQAVALTGDNNDQGGSFQNPGSGIQISDVNGRKYPEHNQRSQSNVFEVEWVAPAEGTGDVRFYSAIVAANNAGGSTGDGAAALSSPVVVTEDVASSTAERFALDARVEVFPNPANRFSTVQISDATAGLYQIDVMNMQGQLLSSQPVEVGTGSVSLNVDLSNQATGLYMIRVSNGDRAVVRRLVKQ